MNLYVLRHAIAIEPGEGGITRDSDRTLTPKGERRTWHAAEALQAMELSLDLVLTSPYKRAKQTAEIVTEVLGASHRLQTTETLAPGGNLRRLVELIHQHESRPVDVMLVGHEPGLSELISMLVFGSTSSGIALKKGGLCKLEIENLKFARCASLAWLLTSRQLCLIS